MNNNSQLRDGGFTTNCEKHLHLLSHADIQGRCVLQTSSIPLILYNDTPWTVKVQMNFNTNLFYRRIMTAVEKTSPLFVFYSYIFKLLLLMKTFFVIMDRKKICRHETAGAKKKRRGKWRKVCGRTGSSEMVCYTIGEVEHWAIQVNMRKQQRKSLWFL